MSDSLPLLLAAVALAVCSTLAGAAQGAGPAPREKVTVRQVSPAGQPRTYQLVEWEARLGRTYDNPFDPDEIALDATFTGPQGQTLVMPGFWAGAAGPAAEGRWLVRFAPPLPGEWTMTLAARDRRDARAADPAALDVLPSDDPGFVRRGPGESRYFRFDSGKSYFMVGLNLGWPDAGGRAERYEPWFRDLAAAGGNFARVWMCDPRLMLETPQSGAGRYDQANAAFYDEVLDLAGQRGIRVMLCLGNHRDFLVKDNWGDAFWPHHPYNAANGGPATRPIDFFTDARARKLYRRRLRYQIARYSAYTSLAFWEFWNEIEFAEIPDVPDDWTAEMARYLKANDPYRHLVTTSANVPESIWKMPEIDLVQCHLYGDGTVANLTAPLAAAAAKAGRFGKPCLIGEFGISSRGSDAEFDPAGTGTALHNSLWSTAMSGTSGTAMHWWWDNYVAPKNLWSTYTGISRFAAAVDWAGHDYRPILLPPPQRRTAGPETYTDLVLTAAAGWGKADGEPLDIGTAGAGGRTVPQHLYGPDKNDLATRLTFHLDLPRPTQMTLRVGQVSDHATLRARLDGKPVADFFFSALPGAPGQQSTKFHPEFNGIYQAVFGADRKLALPAGRHTVDLDLVGGDWLTLESVTFDGLLSSRYAGLEAMALQDGTGRTLAWLHDTGSNWKNDLDGKVAAPVENVTLTVPIPDAAAGGGFSVEWWDTRTGKVVERQSADADAAEAGRVLRLKVPPFRRDVAVRVAPR